MNYACSKNISQIKTLNLKICSQQINKLQTNNIQTAATPLTRLQIKKYCDILGIPVNSTPLKIKDAFYDRSFSVHPDQNPDKNSERLFTELHQAYKALMLHKKHFSEDEIKTVKWDKADRKHVRPWFHSAPKTRKNSPPHDNVQAATPAQQSANIRLFQHAEKNYTYSSAWCEKYYKDLMKKQFLENQRKREKLESQNECVVM